jgi:SAM-dependent methyltransferase
MIETLTDSMAFRCRREAAWAHNISYWLSEPLRHVADVGDYITDRVSILCRDSGASPATIVDMGCGSAWLLRYLLDRRVDISYIGLDGTPAFINHAVQAFEGTKRASFLLADVETELTFPIRADVIVNAFNFFEVCDLPMAMHNAGKLLHTGGKLFTSTIDKTFLILALSANLDEFYENLRRYQNLPGIKYGFQPIDLGGAISEVLEYPSVLYSTQDYIDTALKSGLRLVNYVEQPFTAKTVPKIYCHLEFEKVGHDINP